MANADSRGGGVSAERMGAALNPEHWLLERYWLFSGILLGLAAPIVLFMGSRADLLGIGGYVAVTVGSWAVARRWRKQGALLHLLCMFPYWAWYSQLEGGLPHRLGAGVAEFALMLVFPVLTLVAVEGRRGALAAATLSIGCLVWRWPEVEPRAIGAFLLGSALLIGLVFRRLAIQLDAAHKKLHHMAFHDALTSLPNRRALETAAADALTNDEGGALLFVDLDRFKSVNDVFGHTVGDSLLADIAKRIQDAVPAGELAARIGGDEFAILLRGADQQRAQEVAGRVVSRLGEPFEHEGRVLHVEGSAGVSLWPSHGTTLTTLMKCADVAMYRAKTRKLGVVVHQPSEDDSMLSERGLEVDLWRAIDEQQLLIHLQPVLQLDDDEIVGAEALVRWNHPVHGQLAPGRFIEMAESTGQIVDIDRWVLREALGVVQRWRTSGWSGWIAVNLSARSLESADLLERVKLALDEFDVPAECLVLELTESAAMSDPETTRQRLGDLRELGVRIAIDDFGMGYSSLAYLKRFPADHIKIDRAFTRGIGRHLRDEEVIDLVLDLAAKWKLDVIAEGVETREQYDWLTEHHCACAQGYLIGRPVVPESFVQMVLSLTVDVEGEPKSYRGLRMVSGAPSHAPLVPTKEVAP